MRSLNHNLVIVPCSLVWMCQKNRSNNSKINRLHKRCPRITNFVKESLDETLLKKDGSVSIHNKYSNFCYKNV